MKLTHISLHPQLNEMFKAFTQGLAGEEPRIIKQLQRDLCEANNVANSMKMFV
jgi:hypothetical protein